jgi:indolepyruvate ferredoxin oxidoreductase alpha subunit
MGIDIRFSPQAGQGKRFLFLGNEALVRGCLESGVGFIAQYPGTPTNETVKNAGLLTDLESIA